MQLLVAQGSRTSLTEGAYTSAQAARGKVVYTAKCAGCHKDDLSGILDKGPALSDDAFLINWESENVGLLFNKIIETMPPRDVGSGPSDEDTADLVSYILQVNGYPAGRAALTAGSGLDQLQIVRQAGRSLNPPTNFAVVRSVGCLSHGPGARWMLTAASEPIATRDRASSVAEVGAAASQALGPHTFTLLSVSRMKLESYQGRKIEVKGLLYRSPDENLIDVTSLEAVAASCGSN
jgi:cytochrome c5